MKILNTFEHLIKQNMYYWPTFQMGLSSLQGNASVVQCSTS